MDKVTIEEVTTKYCDICFGHPEKYILTVGDSTLSLCKDCLKKLCDELVEIVYPAPTFVQCDSYDKERERCRGTKEFDECDCGGNRVICSFYEDVREKAKERKI